MIEPDLARQAGFPGQNPLNVVKSHWIRTYSAFPLLRNPAQNQQQTQEAQFIFMEAQLLIILVEGLLEIAMKGTYSGAPTLMPLEDHGPIVVGKQSKLQIALMHLASNLTAIQNGGDFGFIAQYLAINISRAEKSIRDFVAERKIILANDGSIYYQPNTSAWFSHLLPINSHMVQRVATDLLAILKGNAVYKGSDSTSLSAEELQLIPGERSPYQNSMNHEAWVNDPKLWQLTLYAEILGQRAEIDSADQTLEEPLKSWLPRASRQAQIIVLQILAGALYSKRIIPLNAYVDSIFIRGRKVMYKTPVKTQVLLQANAA